MNCIRIIIALLLVFPVVADAHPGRTAGDGCHYCRTNCSSWGEVHGARHCHGGGGGGYTAPTTPTCPYNSYRSGSSCYCNSGYAKSLSGSSCIKIPTNAHKGNGTTDVWECDTGFEEIGNGCVKEVVKVVEPEPIVEEEEKVAEKEDTETDLSTVPPTEEMQLMTHLAKELEKELSLTKRENRELKNSQDSDPGIPFATGIAATLGTQWWLKRRRLKSIG